MFPGRPTVALFALGERRRRAAGPNTLERLAQSTTNGVKFGLIVAMSAIGLSLIFGTTGLINFAHGELVTFGAVVAWFLNARGPQLVRWSPPALAAVAICGVFGGSDRARRVATAADPAGGSVPAVRDHDRAVARSSAT